MKLLLLRSCTYVLLGDYRVRLTASSVALRLLLPRMFLDIRWR